MKIRPLKAKQQVQAAKVFWVLFPFLGFWLLWKFFKFLLRGHKFYSVKTRQKPKSLIGVIAFTSLLFLKRKWFYLQYLAIDKKQQGQGLGTQTLAQIEAKAKGGKHDYFLLLSPPWRQKAQRFYLKRGFKRLLGFVFWKYLK